MVPLEAAVALNEAADMFARSPLAMFSRDEVVKTLRQLAESVQYEALKTKVTKAPDQIH